MLPNPPTAKEDPRVTRTRTLMVEAFMALLAEKNFQALTVQAITERAGVNRATFYSHFPDKYALLNYSIRQAFMQEIGKRTLDACHYSEANLRVLMLVVCEFVSTANGHCATPDAQFEALVETQVKYQLQELLQKWLEQVPLAVDPTTAATAVSWAIYGLAMQWGRERSKKKLSAEKFVDRTLPLVAANLAVAQVA